MNYNVQQDMNGILGFLTAILSLFFILNMIKAFSSAASDSKYLASTIPASDLDRIANKYGWWAARMAEAVCPHNDVACVEREAKRFAETRLSREQLKSI